MRSRKLHLHSRLFAVLVTGLIVIGAGTGLGWYFDRRQSRATERAIALTGGDPNKAQALIVQFGCAGCHQIPGIRGPSGTVGPPLADIGAQIYLAGRLANTPEGLIEWIADPHKTDARSAMPATGISKEQARDVAAYLLSLEK
jgi:cytochrome c